VIALEFLPEMLERTADVAREAGLDRIELLKAEMKAIPLPEASVDLIISNGVIHLSARKARDQGRMRPGATPRRAALRLRPHR